MISLPSQNTTTILPTKTCKYTPKVPKSTPLNPPISTITSGEEEPSITPLNPTLTIESTYPLEPVGKYTIRLLSKKPKGA